MKERKSTFERGCQQYLPTTNHKGSLFLKTKGKKDRPLQQAFGKHHQKEVPENQNQFGSNSATPSSIDALLQPLGGVSRASYSTSSFYFLWWELPEQISQFLPSFLKTKQYSPSSPFEKVILRVLKPLLRLKTLLALVACEHSTPYRATDLPPSREILESPKRRQSK